jgi:hypothetical protein
MATRALIGYLDENNVLTITYNHFDGYDSGLGAALRAHYNSDNKAKEIANVGYISSLCGDTGKWNAAYTQAPTKTTMKPETFTKQLHELADGCWANYVYIWDKDKWNTIKVEEFDNMYVNLVNLNLQEKEVVTAVAEQQFNDSDLLDKLIDSISSHENCCNQDMTIDVHTFYEKILAMRDYIKVVRSNSL